MNPDFRRSLLLSLPGYSRHCTVREHARHSEVDLLQRRQHNLSLQPDCKIRELPHCTLLTLCLQPSLRTRNLSRQLVEQWKRLRQWSRLKWLCRFWPRLLLHRALHRWIRTLTGQMAMAGSGLTRAIRSPSLRRALALLVAYARARLRLQGLNAAAPGFRQQLLWTSTLRWRQHVAIATRDAAVARRGARLCAAAALRLRAARRGRGESNSHQTDGVRSRDEGC